MRPLSIQWRNVGSFFPSVETRNTFRFARVRATRKLQMSWSDMIFLSLFFVKYIAGLDFRWRNDKN